MKGESETSGNNYTQLDLNTGDLKSKITWQQSKYHHIQNQSRGVVSLSLAIITVFLSVFLSFLRPLPDVETERKAIISATEGLLIPLDYTGAIFVILFSIILLIGISLYALYMIGFGLYRLSHIFLDDNNITKIGMASNGLILDRTLGDSQRDLLYKRKIKMNEDIIDVLHSKFISSTLRVFLGFVFAYLTYEVYTYLAYLEFGNLGMIAFFYTTPATLTLGLVVLLSKYTNRDEITLGFGNTKLRHLTENRIDKSFYIFTSGLSFAILLAWLLSAAI